MKEKLVSVIIPAYNCGLYIDECLNSILNQTYKNIEIIVCDDNSTDNTYEILTHYYSDPRVKVIKNEDNKKQGYSRNRCIEISHGEYIMMQDADDISRVDRIELLLNEFNDDIDFVGSGCYYFDDNGRYGQFIVDKKNPERKDLLFRVPFVHASIMFKKECLQTVGGYRYGKHLDRTEDFDLLMRLYGAGFKGKNIDELLYGYRVDQNAIDRRTLRSRIDECYIRYYGYKINNILFPIGWLFILKPIPAYFLQKIKGYLLRWKR